MYVFVHFAYSGIAGVTVLRVRSRERPARHINVWYFVCRVYYDILS